MITILKNITPKIKTLPMSGQALKGRKGEYAPKFSSPALTKEGVIHYIINFNSQFSIS